jgi:hypothetical protein
MTDISPQPDPPMQDLPGPVPPAPGETHTHESVGERVRDWLDSTKVKTEVKSAEQALADLEPLLPAHLATVFTHCARLLADPQMQHLWGDVVDLAFGAAQIGAAAL